MGGLLSPELTSGTKLTPSVVSQANKVYLQAISAWNKSLSSQGLESVQPIKAVGSTAYFEQDSTEQPDELERVYGTPDVVYGDVDYLVQFPFPSDFSGNETERRREENKIKREYGQLMQEFFDSPNSPKEVKAVTSPMLVVELPSGEHVQVDAIVTFPKYSNWMKSRYSSERGLKGYITGNLYAALGDALVLTIGTEGVLARTRGGERVTSRVRKDVIINSVSIDPQNFLMDIARYIIGSDDFEASPTLQRYSGWDEDAVRISDIGKGIVGLAETLEANVEGFSKKELLSNVLSTFEAKLNGTIDKKRKMMAKKGFDGEDKLSELEKQNEKSLRLMSSIFSSGQGLVDLVKEVKSEMEEGIRADKYHSPEVIEAAINQPGYLVHFSDTTKVGINPNAPYNTPIGIYGWLFTDEVFDFSKGWELPYAAQRKYAHILKPRDMSKVLWIGDDSAMSGEIPSRDEIMKTVSSAYPQLSEDELSSVSDGYESGSTVTSTIRGLHQGTRTEDVYDFVTFVSDNLGIYVFDDEQRGKAIANKLFRTLGYDAIIDINCIGAIHANEPCQGFFTSTSGMDLVATLDNEYNPRNKTSQTNTMSSKSVPVEVFRNAFDEYLNIDVEKTVNQGDDQFEIVNMAKHLSLILDINGHKLDEERLLRLNNFIDKVEELDSSLWHFRSVRAKAADLMKDSPLNETISIENLRKIIREVKNARN
jgi:hypothetical protein